LLPQCMVLKPSALLGLPPSHGTRVGIAYRARRVSMSPSEMAKGSGADRHAPRQSQNKLCSAAKCSHLPRLLRDAQFPCPAHGDFPSAAHGKSRSARFSDALAGADRPVRGRLRGAGG